MVVKVYPSEDRSVYCHAEKGAHGVRFVVMYKGSSRICPTPGDVRKAFGVARNTESVKSLYQWCLSMEGTSPEGAATTQSSAEPEESPLPGPLL